MEAGIASTSPLLDSAPQHNNVHQAATTLLFAPGCWVRGLGFRVWNLGFGVCGLGFRVWGLEFGVWSLGFGWGVQNVWWTDGLVYSGKMKGGRVQGVGCGTLRQDGWLRSRMQWTCFRIWGLGFGVSGFRVSGSGFRISDLGFGVWG